MTKRSHGRYVATGRVQASFRECRVDGCGLESLPDIAFPLCGHHTAEIARALAAVLTFWPRYLAAPPWRDPADIKPRFVGVVYYVDLGDCIKIGHTTDLKKRMSSFRTSNVNPVVLATEPGGRNVEVARHRRFASDRLTGELFRKSPQILDHIATLAATAA